MSLNHLCIFIHINVYLCKTKGEMNIYAKHTFTFINIRLVKKVTIA